MAMTNKEKEFFEYLIQTIGMTVGHINDNTDLNLLPAIARLEKSLSDLRNMDQQWYNY